MNLLVMTVLISSCTPTTDKKSETIEGVKTKTDSISSKDTIENNGKKVNLPSDLASLVPIDLLDSKSPSGYDKYGIEFSGNCYACDLASLSVTDNKIIWTNVCDENDTFEIKDFTFSTSENKTILKTSDRTYTLTLIDKAPVYELVIDGKKNDLKNKRLSRYYTTKVALPLFKEHDCGDFEG